jgi:putative tryptophan/tyrosine transport system substrate-binding protein
VGKIARIGYLSSGTATANAALRKAFTDGLRDHGRIEGENIAIEYRWEGAGKPTLDALAADLARLPLDAIVAVNTPASLAMKRTGTTLPVVFATVSEPVAIGLADSLSRPGRNFTGLTTINRELMSKRLEVLKETIPGLARVGYLANPDYEVHKAQLTEMEAAAHSLGLTLHLVEVRAPSEFEGAFARMAAAHVGAFIVQQDDLFLGNRARVIESATQRRLHMRSAYIREPAGSCPTEHTPKICTDARPNTWIESSRAPSHPICRSNGLPSSSGYQSPHCQGAGPHDPPILLLRADQVIE